MSTVTTGIKVERATELEAAGKAGFQALEVTSSLLIEALELSAGMQAKDSGVVSVSVRAVGITSAMLGYLLTQMSAAGICCLVMETEQLGNKYGIRNLLKQAAGIAASVGVCICIENGYRMENGRYHRNGLSSGEELAEFIDCLNQETGCACFGAAVNTGHAGLFGINIEEMIKTLGARIKVIHVNDNDGIRDLHQMPYSFTIGRGELRTDWYGFVRGLMRSHYRGLLLFDVGGLLKNAPDNVWPAMLKLLLAIAAEWEKQIYLDEWLKRDKTRILFGAGNMLGNYMKIWGEQYPPAFVVDNNPELWGTCRYGIEVKAPEAILDIPDEERSVWICNVRYRQIEGQLAQMGVQAACLDDKYFTGNGDRYVKGRDPDKGDR